MAESKMHMPDTYRFTLPLGTTWLGKDYVVASAHTLSEASQRASARAGVPEALLGSPFVYCYVGEDEDGNVAYWHEEGAHRYPTWAPVGVEFED